jgi:hypothetical protein
VKKPWMINRRTFLRGAGAAAALPWLEAMAPAMAAGARPPVRLAFFYAPNGIVLDNWRPKAAGELGDLLPILKNLEPVKRNILILSDLAADHCQSPVAGHEPSGGGFLVGAKCKHSEEPEVGGASVDQLAAQQVGLKTAVDSIAMGIDPGMRGDHGYSGTYLSNISWRSPNTPAALELNPKQLYERLFRGRVPKRPDWESRGAQEKTGSRSESIEGSVLDLVREDARSLETKLGFSDRRKLEEYFEGLRSVERRIEGASKDDHTHHEEGFKDDLPRLVMPDGRGIPSTYAEHVTLMLDILTLAFQSDTTRVASFLFSCEKSGRAYPEIDAPGSHHGTSHHQNKPENLAKLTNINAHHMSLFAKMLERMATIDEGGSTLLDNVMICYGSGISDSNKHNHDNLPILVAGGGGGAVRGGRHVVYGKKTPVCNLYLEMLARIGVELPKFGDSTGRLDLLA